MRIFDCFLFNGEHEMLDLRVSVLKDVVDRFVVVESTETFQRHPKSLTLANRPLDGQLTYLIEDSDLPPEENIQESRLREKACREKIKEGLRDADPEDIVIVSDVDEIPHPDFVASFRTEYAHLAMLYTVRLNMNLYYYHFNCRVIDPCSWFVPMVTTVERIMASPVHEHRYDHWGNPELRGAGWHFAYFGGVEGILKKFYSNSDNCHLRDDEKDTRIIKKRMEKLEDPHGRCQSLRWTEETEELPIYVQKNLEKYYDMGWLKVKP